MRCAAVVVGCAAIFAVLSPLLRRHYAVDGRSAVVGGGREGNGSRAGDIFAARRGIGQPSKYSAWRGVHKKSAAQLWQEGREILKEKRRNPRGASRLVFTYGKVGSGFASCVFRAAGWSVAHVTNATLPREEEEDGCEFLPDVVDTHSFDVARYVLACARALNTSSGLVVWTVARDLASRSPSAFWENRVARGADDVVWKNVTAGARDMARRYAQFLADTFEQGNECDWFARFAELFNTSLGALNFDESSKRAYLARDDRGGAPAATLLLTRFDDIADWSAIVRDVLPDFDAAACPDVVHDKSQHEQYRAFHEAATPLPPAILDRYASCDTTNFLPLTPGTGVT